MSHGKFLRAGGCFECAREQYERMLNCIRQMNRRNRVRWGVQQSSSDLLASAPFGELFAIDLHVVAGIDR